MRIRENLLVVVLASFATIVERGVVGVRIHDARSLAHILLLTFNRVDHASIIAVSHLTTSNIPILILPVNLILAIVNIRVIITKISVAAEASELTLSVLLGLLGTHFLSECFCTKL